MKFRIRFAEQIVGLFVLIAIVALVGILILMGANQRWFAKNYYFESRFDSGKGLNVGMPITLKGFQIGKVDDIFLNEANKVEVSFFIYDTYYPKVKKNSVLELTSSTLGLGGGGLVFHPGKNDEGPLSENSFVPSLDSKEGQQLVTRGLVAIPEKEDMITNLLDKVEPILENLNETLVSVNSLVGSVHSTVEGKNEGPLGDILEQADELTIKLNIMIEDTTKMISRTSEQIDTLLAQVNGITDNLNQTTAAFRDPTGMVKTVLDPKGSIATILDDENALYNQIDAILESVKQTTTQLQEFSAFINNKSPEISSVINKSNDALDKGRDVLEGIKNNPLIRGGIVEQKEQPTTFQSYRDEEF
jgi:phospholipid/cholesterol/gamma-HCH transport system substrate-binding protein